MIPNETTRLVQANGQLNQNSSGRRAIIDDHLENGGFEQHEESMCRCCCTDCGKSFIFGAFDDLIASLAIVAACAGSRITSNIVIIIGFATLLSNSLSMGVSEFLSSKAHKEFMQAEKRRELWEFKHYKDGEINEMINRFETRGMARRDAEMVVTKMAQYENFFVGLMVSEELGLQVPEGNDAELMTDAFVMFLSFFLFGMVPISFYILGFMNILSEQNIFIISSSVSLFILAGLGMVKSSFSSASVLYSAFESLLLGVIAVSLSYIAGDVLETLLNG